MSGSITVAPEQATRSDLAELVLDWVNQLRREHALGDVLASLPTGRPYDVERCVIARAVDAGHCIVEDDLLTLHSRTNEHGDSWITGLPTYVSAFLEAFDAGAYPDLTENRLAS